MEKIAKFEKVSLAQYAEDCPERAAETLEGVRLPVRATGGSAGYDFFAPFDFTLEVGESIVVPTGIRAIIAEGWVLLIFPRSGLGFKYRLQLDNTVGVIDSDYYGAKNEGHIKIKLTNNGLSGKAVTVANGTAFAQGVFLPFGVTEDDDSFGNVRLGGFGSTGGSN